MPNITRVSISKLNGHTNVDFPVRGHCVIVGPNGSGKSTALQIIALALGRQWKALSVMRFDTLKLFFGEREISVDRDACNAATQMSGNPSRFGRTYRNLRA